MTFILQLYRGITHGLSPLAPFIYGRRLVAGKELPGRLNERLANDLAKRPEGPLVWMHGASVGESKLLLGLAEALAQKRPSLNILFTSQTASSAGLVNRDLPNRAIQQMAPLDTPHATERFITHWSPDICIFAEGEVWPNLLSVSKARGCKTALINARMTEKSLQGWRRAPKTARKLFSSFDVIIASDQRTASGLGKIVGRQIESSGNLKIALAGASHLLAEHNTLTNAALFSEGATVLLGASTHAGEEQLLLDALAAMQEPVRLILAPRHIDRAEHISRLVAATGLPYATRSAGDTINVDTRILIADTMGEMDLWYHNADIVYLGGGHMPGIGGHNPIEPLRHGRPIITGPHTDNFSDTYKSLADLDGVQIVRNAEDLGQAFRTAKAPTPRAIEAYFENHQSSLEVTLSALTSLLDEKRLA